ncbi:recombinase family protein [Sinomonas humi]|uniref:Resolvase/invertase-type recombinase catalytic domain-containing protein n=1 Tax=Sinomonas humi TaxID=1338436 RepID=A0A0B2AF85_9MICC|nr:recombinase family protein [Sinomonas humi]KHL00431.1 hypothetical protein LK10_19660 [Sinomonas humi]
MTTKAAVWARVSTAEQTTENQLQVLHDWAGRRGLDVVAAHAIEDSAYTSTNGKGQDFDRQRAELLNGARLGHYDVVLVWSLDRLSRRGMEDTLATLRLLTEHGCAVWSHQEPWLHTSDPAMRELLVGITGWMAQQESKRRSERTKAGIERRRKAGLPVGGRKAGAKDRKPRKADGYLEAWADGGKRRAAEG